MPNITVELFKGRTLDARREFARRVTQAAVDVLGARPETVRIRFVELDKTEIAKAGILEADRD